ncbi:PAS domain-containing sensor histidine kinase [Thermopetrobacter sp. TC1]|uniref:hybrid sensor histidine kinase/response regulator n=1 Tax=Thermopetrobacter sp. TC1 TaxID=1495045 RepID=UPI00068B3F0C|nr:PAS domain-containing sensor histidine kinase [Thermopetrobacter sp. TC1]
MTDIALAQAERGVQDKASSQAKAQGAVSRRLAWVLAGGSALAGVALAGFSLMQKMAAAPAPEQGGGFLLPGLVLIAAGLGLAGGLLLGRDEAGGAQDATLAARMLDACGEACLLSDVSGRPVQANRPYYELLERAGKDRLAGVDHLFAGRPEVAESIYRLSLKARDGEAGVEEFYLPDGGPLAKAGGAWLKVEARPFDENGTILWKIADVTAERGRQDQAVRDLQALLDWLETLPAGVMASDGEGDVIYLNATLAQWLGLDLDVALQKGLKLETVLPEDVARRLDAIRPEKGGSVTESFIADLKDAEGRLFPVRIVHRVEVNGEGQVRSRRTVFLRMDDAEIAALHEPLRIVRLMNASPMGIALVHADGRLAMFNAALAQITPQARLEGDIAEIVHEDDRNKFLTAFTTVAEGQQRQAQVDVRINSEVETRAQVTIVATETDEDGTVRMLTVYLIDTTLHEAMQQELEQGQKMQVVGRFVSGIAHDFNNMLTAILGFSDILMQRHRPEDPSFEAIMDIRNNANRAARMVRQLLAFSRKQTLRPEVLALDDLLADMVSLLRRMLGEKINLTLEHGRDLWPVMADGAQLDQVIMNLAVNARDAMPKGGDLIIRTRNVPTDEAATVAPDIMPPGEYVLIEVTDTGEGMPPEVLEKIYDPFFTTKAVGKGTGLGLSTVYGIVKQTGGYIFCDSEVGKGTTFRIYLPRHVETEEERKERLRQKRKQREGRMDLTGEGLILLVEDEPPVRKLAVQALRQRGYTVVEAPCGEVAVDLAEEMLKRGEVPDLVVSDVVMPGMDGPTMMKELRKLGVDAPFVFMSGHAEDAFAQSLEKGAEFTFLAKPFNLRQIAEKVKEAMQKGKSKQAA